MATGNYDRGRCLRYKSDLQANVPTSSIPPVVSPSPPVQTSHNSLFFWTFLSLVGLLLFIIFRRQDDKTHQEKEEEEKNDRSNEINDQRQTLPSISEENQNQSFSKINLQETFSIISNENSLVDQDPLVLDNLDRDHSSLISDRQTTKQINDKKNLDEFIEVTPLNKDLPLVDETSHPIIFRKFYSPHENAIPDEFNSLEEVNRAVEEVGLVRSQLIFGIDYTISNLETGKHSFNGLSLHHIEEGLLNPYQRVITIIGRTLEKFDSDSLIPAFGFGDRTTLDRKIFPLRPDGNYCRGFRGVLQAYNKITPKVRMSGPTNFGPLIKEAIRIVKKTNQYHILVIVADGQVTNERQTREAIVEASHYPLSIVMIGVGDGPWDMMKEFDDSLPTRQFDNFQFVNYNSVVQASLDTDADFALHALMEIPSQYAAIKKLGLLKDS